MNPRSEHILAELGAKPLWRLRVPMAAMPASEPVEPSLVAESRVELAQENPAENDAGHANCSLCGRSKKASAPEATALRADWMFLTEAGETLSGDAARLFEQILLAAGLKSRDSIQLASLVTCSPAATVCEAWLAQQIAAAQPRVLIALGEAVGRSVLGAALDEAAEAQVFSREGLPVLLMPTPNELLQEPMKKAQAWEALCLALDLLER
jgi:uracil-DNA glycosylase family 4